MVTHATTYLDIDEAHAAAERLAHERRQTMAEENVQIMRRVLEASARKTRRRFADLDDAVE